MSILNPEENQRYARQIKLVEWGIEAQEQLKNTSILVVGAGGLGHPCLQYLCCAGAGTLGMVDHDVVEVSNLHRQPLFNLSDCGKAKVEVVKEKLGKLNPHVTLNSHLFQVDVGNVLVLIKQYDIIVDCTDNFHTRYVLNDACVLTNKPLVYGAIHKFEGQIAVFNQELAQGKFSPNYRDLFPEPPAPGSVNNCAETGVIGVLPGIIGNLQAMEALKLATGIGKPLAGKLFTLDLWRMESFEMGLSSRPGSRVEKLDANLPEYCEAIPETKATGLNPDQLKKILDNGNLITLVDIRETYEREICAIAPSLHIPMHQLLENPSLLPSKGGLILYCHHGQRSAMVLKALEGFSESSRLVHLEGGIHRWMNEVDPSLAAY